MSTDNRNATASWSGYLHQGKVGIFVALKKINALIDELPEEERGNSDKIQEKLENWEIIYENAEDFDIRELNNDGSIKIVESRHQVKANKSGRNLNDYKKVLSKKLQEKVKNSNPISYNEIINKSVFQIEVYKDDEMTENKEQKNILSLIGEEKRFLHTIVDVNGKNEDGTIMDEQIYNSLGFGRAIWIDNPQNVRFYEYEEGKFYCELSTQNDNLKYWSIFEINKIITDNSKSASAYEGLLWELDQEIRKKHATGNYPILYFTRILEIITSDNSIKKFEEGRVRESFIDSYVEYKLNLDEENIEYTQLEKETDEIIQKIYELKRDDFYQFCNNIHPNDLNFSKEKNLNKTGLRQVFFKSLLNINNFIFDEKSFICNENKRHIPTTFDDALKAQLLQIVKNTELTESLFEGSFIINKEFEGDIIDKIINLESMTRYRNEEDSTKTNWDNINRGISDNDLFLNPKGIKMIKVQDAIEKLNN